MKFLKRFKMEDGKKILLEYSSVPDNEEIIFEYEEVKELPPKEEFWIDTRYNYDENKFEQVYVPIVKSETEMTMSAMKELLRKTISIEFLSKEELNKYKFIFPEYKLDHPYVKNDVVFKDNTLYKCKISHTSNYGLLPSITPDYWKDLLKEEEEVKATPFYRDVTYKKGDHVIYYRKIYESLEKQSGVTPEDNPKTWKFIKNEG